MEAFQQGIEDRETEIVIDEPPRPDEPFIAVGQLWCVERMVPRAIEAKVPFWLLDSGFYRSKSAGGMGDGGCYEVTYRGLTPILMNDPDYSRWPNALEPWREPTDDGHVLIGLPGPFFNNTTSGRALSDEDTYWGHMLGIDTKTWMRTIVDRVRQVTDRPIKIRERKSLTKLKFDLFNAHCVITHSSKVGVDAIRMGIPVICEPTCAAAPVASQSLTDIENLPRPDRRQWWASLMTQQVILEEIQDGTAWRLMQRVVAQVDG